MGYLKAIQNEEMGRFKLLPANDTTSSLFPAIKTVKYTSGNNVTIPLSNTSYTSGKTYYVKVKFRTRGDGDSTSSKCSSIGFIANKFDWSNSYSYIHNSATAYAERGQIVEWTYQFTATATDTRSTALYFIVNNGWANGADNQTIDLFYYKFWDSDGNVYDEDGYLGDSEVKNWEDGTPIATEKSGTFIVSEVLEGGFFYYGGRFLIDIDGKTTSTSNTKCFIQFRKVGGEIITYKSITLTQTYKHYRITIPLYNKEYQLNKVYICFEPSNGSTILNLKNLKLRRITLEQIYPIDFLKVVKNNNIYYHQISHKTLSGYARYYDEMGKLKLMKNGDAYYLRLGMENYKYSEITTTYDNLHYYYEY